VPPINPTLVPVHTSTTAKDIYSLTSLIQFRSPRLNTSIIHFQPKTRTACALAGTLPTVVEGGGEGGTVAVAKVGGTPAHNRTARARGAPAGVARRVALAGLYVGGGPPGASPGGLQVAVRSRLVLERWISALVVLRSSTITLSFKRISDGGLWRCIAFGLSRALHCRATEQSACV
jgi:hypothetical protein